MGVCSLLKEPYSDCAGCAVDWAGLMEFMNGVACDEIDEKEFIACLKENGAPEKGIEFIEFVLSNKSSSKYSFQFCGNKELAKEYEESRRGFI